MHKSRVMRKWQGCLVDVFEESILVCHLEIQENPFD